MDGSQRSARRGRSLLSSRLHPGCSLQQYAGRALTLRAEATDAFLPHEHVELVHHNARRLKELFIHACDDEQAAMVRIVVAVSCLSVSPPAPRGAEAQLYHNNRDASYVSLCAAPMAAHSCCVLGQVCHAEVASLELGLCHKTTPATRWTCV